MQRFKPLGQPPKVWQLVEKTTKDGKRIKFTIQEIPEDRYEDAIQHMFTYFLDEEPICRSLNVKNNPLYEQDVRETWHLLLAEGISVAAFVDNPNGGKPIIAGMNALGIDCKNHKDSFSNFQFKSERWKNTIEILSTITKKVVYEGYEVDKYLYGFGLSVDPSYRGCGLSKDILKVRDLIGSTYGVPATATVFTSLFSQKAAAATGFEELLTQNYVDLVDKDGKEYFPNITSKAFIIMGKKWS